MFINKEEALVRAEQLKQKINDENEKEIKKHNILAQQQRKLVKRMFGEKFNEWYIEYTAKLKTVPCKFLFINNDVNVYDICVNPDIDYSIRLFPKFKSILKNELLTVVNNELKNKGFRIYKVLFEEHYFCGPYLDMYVYICDINSINCTIM